jgi:hypothetical protein
MYCAACGLLVARVSVLGMIMHDPSSVLLQARTYFCTSRSVNGSIKICSFPETFLSYFHRTLSTFFEQGTCVGCMVQGFLYDHKPGV